MILRLFRSGIVDPVLDFVKFLVLLLVSGLRSH